MERNWLVRPDTVIDTEFGPVGVVSREAQAEAFMDALSVQDRCGGGITTWSERAPTGVPGEMVTTALFVQWRDRTDAKPQPERPTSISAQRSEPRVAETQVIELDLDELEGPQRPAASEENPDGFDVAAAEEAVDETAIPAEAR